MNTDGFPDWFKDVIDPIMAEPDEQKRKAMLGEIEERRAGDNPPAPCGLCGTVTESPPDPMVYEATFTVPDVLCTACRALRWTDFKEFVRQCEALPGGKEPGSREAWQ
jgi:hypothetical protein